METRIAIINQLYLLASQLFFPPNQKKKSNLTTADRSFVSLIFLEKINSQSYK